MEKYGSITEIEKADALYSKLQRLRGQEIDIYAILYGRAHDEETAGPRHYHGMLISPENNSNGFANLSILLDKGAEICFGDLEKMGQINKHGIAKIVSNRREIYLNFDAQREWEKLFDERRR